MQKQDLTLMWIIFNMATRQNTDYGYDIQKVYLEMMLTDAETFVRCQAVFGKSKTRYS